MLTITDLAVSKLKEISESEEIGHFSVRVKIIGGGCAGMTYDMLFDDMPTDMDESIEKDGVTVIIDPLSLQYMENVEVDYSHSEMGGGAFKFNNSAVTSTCACGSSVSF